MTDSLDFDAGRELVSRARTVVDAVATDESTPEDAVGSVDAIPERVAGAFVTLTRGEELRGCCGRPRPEAPLPEVVVDAALDAARNDPRFRPLRSSELEGITISVTVLSKPEPVEVTDPSGYPDAIEVGRHGLVVESDHGAGLLLPSVAIDRDWGEAAFLTATCQKAGLPGDAWRRDAVTVKRFSARKFAEGTPYGPVVMHTFGRDPLDRTDSHDETHDSQPSTGEPRTDGGRDVRRPAVAGQFYAAAEAALREQIEACFTHDVGPGLPDEGPGDEEAPAALVSPHAGLPYSGPVAAHGMGALANGPDPGVVVVLGPNHDGRGDPVALSPASAWRTPLGAVEVDAEVTDAIVDQSEVASLDPVAHRNEHSIEVQVPFLQYVLDDASIVPICMRRQDRETAREVGAAIADAVAETARDAVVVASTDLTHYRPHDRAVEADEPVVDAIESLDVDGLVDHVDRTDHSMCGPGPTIAAMTAAREFGATDGVCRQYATSADTAGDDDSVVGYASVVLS